MRGGVRGHAQRFQPGLREHMTHYNLEESARRRFKVALETLKQHDESLRIALQEVGAEHVHPLLLAAIARLAHGAKGEFR